MGNEAEQTTESAQATDTGTPAVAQNTDNSQDGQQAPGPVPYERFKEVNDRLRALEAQQSKAASAADKAEMAKLAEEKRYQEIIDKLTPQADRAAALESVVTGLVKARVDKLQESHRELIPGGPPEEQLAWLAKAEASGLFGRLQAPDTHASSGTGAGGDALAVKADGMARRAGVLDVFGINAKPEDLDRY